jgi:hypothetical protein
MKIDNYIRKFITDRTGVKISNSPYHLNYEKTGQEASNIIRKQLESDKPSLITRFGSVELKGTLNYYFINKYNRNKFKSRLNYWLGNYPYLNAWDPTVINNLLLQAGFFPDDKILVKRFAELTLECAIKIDVLGIFHHYEKHIEHLIKDAKKIRLPDIEPYFHADPWTTVLKGKRILVVHPYKETIESQYLKRDKLFRDDNVLPIFKSLRVIKSIQTIANSKERGHYQNWFEALEIMKSQIKEEDFDIAIIGAGAYGMPLAAYVKDIGKKAIHMGGATQVLFGIKGQRWDSQEWFANYLYNENWVRPSSNEIPDGAKKVENGCYW